MKKRIISAAIAGMLGLFPLLSQAQVIDAEKTYEITRKSKRGTLANVEFDNNSGNYLLY